MALWLFQGNLEYYRILDAIRDLEQMHWLVTRHDKDIAPGDRVLVWVAGKQAGIYAIAEVTEPAKLFEFETLPERQYWKDASYAKGKYQAMIRFTCKLLDTPLLRVNLLKDPILKNLLVIRAPNRTNFKVKPEEWQRVEELLKELV